MATKKETEHKQTQDQFDVNQEIDELLQSMSGNFSEIEAQSALGLVEKWHDFLHSFKEAEVKELASGLKELQKLLKSGKATGHEISEVLIHIGEQTSEFSSNAEKGLKQPTQRLGKQLRKAGTSIAKAEDQEYHQQMDTLVEKAENEELTSLDAEEAVEAIDLWYNLLHKTEGEQYQQLANSLKGLKQALKRGNAKPQTIAKALNEVGEQATKIASVAPRGFKGAIQKLGKQLVSAGESLTR
jgi:hypothetical protein